MRFSCIGTAVIGSSLTYLFTTNKRDLIAANVIMIGVVIVPIIPVGINFSGELTFPIEPTVATGTLMMTGQLFGFFLALAAGPLTLKSQALAIGLFSICAAIASICSVVI